MSLEGFASEPLICIFYKHSSEESSPSTEPATAVEEALHLGER